MRIYLAMVFGFIFVMSSTNVKAYDDFSFDPPEDSEEVFYYTPEGRRISYEEAVDLMQTALANKGLSYEELEQTPVVISVERVTEDSENFYADQEKQLGDNPFPLPNFPIPGNPTTPTPAPGAGTSTDQDNSSGGGSGVVTGPELPPIGSSTAPFPPGGGGGGPFPPGPFPPGGGGGGFPSPFPPGPFPPGGGIGNNPVGTILSVLDHLVAIGDRVYKLVEKGRPVVEARATPIAVLPKAPNGSELPVLDVEHWNRHPKSSRYRMQFKNPFGITMVKFQYAVQFTYGGSYQGKGKYIKGVLIAAEHAFARYGIDFTALSRFISAQNLTTREDPMAAATMMISYQIKGMFVNMQSNVSYQVSGDGVVYPL